MRTRLTLAALALLPAALLAQDDPRAQLVARGLPADLAQQVAQIAADAAAQGLPTAPIVDKAIEGFAKHAPPVRITAALQQFAERMAQARAAVQQAGSFAPRGDMIAAAAEAMGRGIAAAQVGAVVQSAREPAVAAPGLTVTAALAGQGMPADEAGAGVGGPLHPRPNPPPVLHPPP